MLGASPMAVVPTAPPTAFNVDPVQLLRIAATFFKSDIFRKKTRRSYKELLYIQSRVKTHQFFDLKLFAGQYTARALLSFSLCPRDGCCPTWGDLSPRASPSLREGVLGFCPNGLVPTFTNLKFCRKMDVLFSCWCQTSHFSTKTISCLKGRLFLMTKRNDLSAGDGGEATQIHAIFRKSILRRLFTWGKRNAIINWI